MTEDKRRMYKDLDERLNSLMQKFWEDYPSSEGISCSGSVLYGEWHVRREGFEGISFKLSDKMMDEFVVNGKITLKESDMVSQKEYKDD